MLFFCASVDAQTGPPALEQSSSPGARSLALGGAFVALADDATAAFANPAGLHQIARPEVSIELRGLAEFDETGSQTDFPEAVSGVGFVSFVYPIKDWSFAFYRNELVNIESSTGVGNESEFDPFLSAGAVRTTADLKIVTYAFSAAYSPKENVSSLAHIPVSFGLGISHFSGKLESRTEQEGAGAREIRVDDSDWGVNAGALWHISPQFNLGGFYRQAATFDGTEVLIGPAPDAMTSSSGAVSFPDAFGLGFAFKSRNGTITASAEWDHIRYSTTSKGLYEDIELDDSDELHLGIEYAFIGTAKVFAIRGGAWFDPEQAARVVGDETASSVPTGIRGDLWHLAFGVGWAYQRFQIDLGFDISELSITASLSGIVNF